MNNKIKIILFISTIVFLHFPLFCTRTFLYYSEDNELWVSENNWWLGGSTPYNQGYPDSYEDIALLSELNFPNVKHEISLYGTGAVKLRGLHIIPTFRTFTIGPGADDFAGSFIFDTDTTPTPYIRLYTSDSNWEFANTISADIEVGSLMIEVGPYQGTNTELILSGAVTSTLSGGQIMKAGAADLVFKSTVEPDIDIAEGNLIFDGVTNYPAALSGNGNFIKKGSGNLTMIGALALVGSITIQEGTLTLEEFADFSTPSLITINPGASLILDTTLGTLELPPIAGGGTIQLNDKILTINESQISSFSGVIEGSGGITKTGSETLILEGQNTYTGPTVVSTGTLILSKSDLLSTSSLVTVNSTLTLSADNSIKDLAGSGTVALEGNTLTISLGGSGDFSGVISDGLNSNGGNITKSGGETATLSGNNTFTGNLTLSRGGLNIGGTNAYTGSTYIATNGNMLIQNSGDISNSRSVLLDGTLIFNGSSSAQTIQNLSGAGSLAINNSGITVSETLFNGALIGTVSGTGNLTKTGSMSLTLSGNSSGFLGTTYVNEGTLIVTGDLGGNLEVQTNGTLQGNGTLGTGSNTVTNSGTVAPGTSIGSLTISGDYTQESDGNLEIEIAPDGSRDRLIVSGEATLAGTVTISPLPGLYQANTAYTFITAGTRTNTFSQLVELNQVTGILSYDNTSVTYTLAQIVPVLPVSLGELKGNAKRIAAYLFRLGSSPNNSDLENVYNLLLDLNTTYFPIALQRLGPTQFGAFPLVSLQSDVRAADLFLTQCRRFLCQNACSKEEVNSKPNLWVQPLLYQYTQRVYEQERGLQEQIKFNALTFGSMVGSTLQLSDQWFLSPGVGYTHTNLRWEKKAGKARWDTLYIAPAIGWNTSCCRTYVNMTLLSAINFYDVYRHIFFTGLNRKAHNYHTGFDFLARVDGGCLFKFGVFYIQPDATFNALAVLEPTYTEEGADSLNLTVYRKTNVYLRPQVTTRFGFRFGKEKRCFSPSVKVGWVSDIPLTNGFYHARLRNETFLTGNQFPVLSFHRATAQLVVGGELSLQLSDLFFSAQYSANFLDYSRVQMGRLRVDWKF